MHCTTAHTQKEAKYTLVKAKQDEKVACVSERESVVYTECDFNNDESRSTQALLLHQMSLKNVLPVKPLWWVAVYYEETILWEDLFLMAWPTTRSYASFSFKSTIKNPDHESIHFTLIFDDFALCNVKEFLKFAIIDCSCNRSCWLSFRQEHLT